jgi:hypothetical protein
LRIWSSRRGKFIVEEIGEVNQDEEEEERKYQMNREYRRVGEEFSYGDEYSAKMDDGTISKVKARAKLKYQLI